MFSSKYKKCYKGYYKDNTTMIFQLFSFLCISENIPYVMKWCKRAETFCENMTQRSNEYFLIKNWKHEKSTSYIEQILEATPLETTAVRPLTPISKTIQVRQTRHAVYCLRSKDEFISDVLQWNPTNSRASVGRLARTYLQQLCVETGCRLEDMPRAIEDRDEWGERERERKRKRESQRNPC